ncbi:MAG: hypothetical protein J4N64_08910 [Chloroflexi bacterium]|nr:hypothetical protein [Chloroflexota bacterium]
MGKTKDLDTSRIVSAADETANRLRRATEGIILPRLEQAYVQGAGHGPMKAGEREISFAMPEYRVNKVQDGLNKIQKAINGSKILALAVTCKADIEDLRESPALEII